MKELITTILIICIIWILLYFAIAFINVELNAFKWYGITRAIYIVLCFFTVPLTITGLDVFVGYYDKD